MRSQQLKKTLRRNSNLLFLIGPMHYKQKPAMEKMTKMFAVRKPEEKEGPE